MIKAIKRMLKEIKEMQEFEKKILEDEAELQLLEQQYQWAMQSSDDLFIDQQ